MFTHSSWREGEAASYEPLAFLGDSVLALAVSTDFIEEASPPDFTAGRMTKIRGRAVSAPACKAVAEDLGLPARLRAAAPEGVPAETLASTLRAPAEVLEALIGACFLHFGWAQTRDAVVSSFREQIDRALKDPEDAKSALQERLARRGQAVEYRVAAEEGPAHDRTFEVQAVVEGEVLGSGRGRSKKDAEQVAAQATLTAMGA